MLVVIFWLFLAFKSSMAEVIRVFAAADLQYALKEIAQEYMKANPQDRVELVFGSSGKGAIQIRKGAPYHLFFSADMRYVEELHREGYIITQPKQAGGYPWTLSRNRGLYAPLTHACDFGGTG